MCKQIFNFTQFVLETCTLEKMQDDCIDHPWECKGLDPFRDDPIASDSECGNDDIGEAKSDDLEVSDVEAPCTCGNCVHMPSLEERLCCKRLLGWQREYDSGGVKYLDNSCAVIKLSSPS